MSRASNLIRVKLAFASGNEEDNRNFVERFASLAPDVPLFVVSEFPPATGEWIPWHVLRGVKANTEAIRNAMAGKQIATAAFLLNEHPPLRGMKFAAMQCGANRVLAFDQDFKPIPVSVTGIPRWAGYAARQARRFLQKQFAPGGRGRKWVRRLAHPAEAEIPFLARRAQLYGVVAARLQRRLRERRPEHPMPVPQSLQPGLSVIIPSRDGRDLLEQLFPTLLPQIAIGEVIVSDNGSTDGTGEWLTRTHPLIEVIRTTMPLSFARAVNLGILKAKYTHIFLLNNDMLLEPGCILALQEAFRKVPDLFCATAQIFFPEGIRREETGKAVWRTVEALDFPVRCDIPLEGEDLTWVLYGSGGCSLFDTEKLRALGGVAEVYEPAYVEDMDFGYRAWKRGWPTVYCAGAKVEHRHRATTARFFTENELQFFVERNYLRFLICGIGSPALFQTLWSQAIRRLQLLAMRGEASAIETLRNVPRIGALPREAQGFISEDAILALGSGDIAVFPGRGRSNEPIVVASPYLPYPLSHGGAVRMFHLMRECNRERGQILVSFVDRLEPVPAELLDLCAEIVLVQRHGSHYRKNTEMPDVVEEFASEAFAAALQQTVRKWSPGVVQLEFTQMALYAKFCKPAKTLLVEHDITFDLMSQLLELSPETGLKRLETSQQLSKWKRFETEAWHKVDCVVTMSKKDLQLAAGAKRAWCIPNGVDTVRFQPAAEEPEPGRILFLGSFQHLPNLLGLSWFLNEVWPLLGSGFQLHVIAGSRHKYYADFYRDRVKLDALPAGIHLDGFVSDVRPAYQRAQIVIAPLIASAGTNIKVLEAMAMGKCVVSTSAGINGLDLQPGTDILVADTPAEFAQSIRDLASDSGRRVNIENAARTTAVNQFDWQSIGELQSEIYGLIE